MCTILGAGYRVDANESSAIAHHSKSLKGPGLQYRPRSGYSLHWSTACHNRRLYGELELLALEHFGVVDVKEVAV